MRVCTWLIDRIFLAEPFPPKPMTFVGFVKIEARVRRKFKTRFLRPPDVVLGCVRGPPGAPYLPVARDAAVEV